AATALWIASKRGRKGRAEGPLVRRIQSGVARRFPPHSKALAMMDHPNIAKVLDAGTTGDDRGADFSPQEHLQAETLWAGKSTPSAPEVRRTEVRAPIH